MIRRIKKYLHALLWLGSSILFSTGVSSQVVEPDWKFYMAFEDFTGTKDTIFFIKDSSATLFGVDTALGETPIHLQPTGFQVYMTLGSVLDTSKVWAVNINSAVEHYIFAVNYIYPITISWDTSLFKSPNLPMPIDCAEMQNDYFYFSGGICHVFNLLSTNTVVAPEFNWWSMDHFPLIIEMNSDSFCCLDNINEEIPPKFSLSPNPVFDNLQIKSKSDPIKKVVIYSMQGQKISTFDYPPNTNSLSLPCNFLLPGLYLIEIISYSYYCHYEKLIKE